MKTINSRRIREKKIIEYIQKQINDICKRNFIEDLDMQDENFKDPVLPKESGK
jgi:hypothetical protein